LHKYYWGKLMLGWLRCKIASMGWDVRISPHANLKSFLNFDGFCWKRFPNITISSYHYDNCLFFLGISFHTHIS
jgi:hypothetical protein